MSSYFRVMTYNVRCYPPMRQAVVDACLRLAEGEADLYSWQEFFLPRYRRALRGILPPRAYGHNAPDNPSGLALSYRRSRFALVRRGRAIPGHGKVPHSSGKRDIQNQILRDRESGATFAHASAHPTPGAWAKGYRRNRKGRRRAWHTYFRRLTGWAAAKVRQGHAVVIGMDGNAPHWRVVQEFEKRFGPGRVKVRSNGIDHLVFVDGDRFRWQLHGKAVLHRGNHSDHAPLVVRARLVRR